ncbi:MAG: hypothetical protein IJU52_05565 [Clostridia bacterium]|nr:hypothetical protein [Clostridia bacterium]
MKKALIIVLTLAMLLGIFTLCASAEEVELIAKESDWDYVLFEEESDAEAPAGWLDKTDSATWETAQAPFSGSSWTNAIAVTVFPSGNFTAFLRKTFTLEEASKVTELIMTVIYDEDPAVYINGTLVWEKTGYQDQRYQKVDLSEYKDVLKDGENVVCVRFCNAVGGAVYDMTLSAQIGEKEPDPTDDTQVKVKEVTTIGFANFGAINDPENVLDMDQNSVTGSGFNAGAEQSVLVTFIKKYDLSKIFVQCKDEGTTTNEDNTRGTYQIFAVNDEEETLVAEIPAVTGTDGGYTLTLDAPVAADAVKIKIVSWEGDCWACVADVAFDGVASQGNTNPPVVDTGDNTAVIAALAIAAILGTAVVVTKKVFTK